MIPSIANMNPAKKLSSMDLLTGLQAYWKFEESSDNLYDSHGSKNFIPAGGTFTYGLAGINGNCISPPDYNPYAYSNSGLGTSIGDLSISLWVNFSHDIMSLFSIGRYNENNHLAIKIDNYILTAYIITKSGWTNSWDECSVSGINGAWHNVIFIRDMTNGKQELYIDGSLEQSVTSLNIAGSLSVSDKFFLYDWALSSLSQWSRYYGKSVNRTHRVDEIAVYNTVLNSEQITALAGGTYYENF